VCFNKCKAKLGAQGTVAHMFDHRAIFVFKHDSEDTVLEALMDHDVDVSDIESDDGLITVLVPTTEFFKTKTALTEAFPKIHFEMEEITFIPQTHTAISGEDAEMFDKFLDMLNALDDVQEIYHNAELPG
jgi:transcriptional/translational regulatory protein YebC/TACO1